MTTEERSKHDEARRVPAGSATSPAPPSRAAGARKAATEAGVRDPEARREPPALRPAAGARRRDEELGGAEGAEPRPGGEAAGDAGGGPPDRVQRLRGHDPQGRVRRRDGDDLGPRHVHLRGRRRPRPRRGASGGATRKATSRSCSRASGSRARGCWCGPGGATPSEPSGSSSSTATSAAEPGTRGRGGVSDVGGDRTHDGRDRGGPEASRAGRRPAHEAPRLAAAAGRARSPWAAGATTAGRESADGRLDALRRRPRPPGRHRPTAPDVALLEHLVDEYEQLDVVMDELARAHEREPREGQGLEGGPARGRARQRLLASAAGASSASAITREPRRARRGGRIRSRRSRARPAPARSTRWCSSHHQRVYQAIGRRAPASFGIPGSREVLLELQQHLGRRSRS